MSLIICMWTKLAIRTSRTRWSPVSDFWGWQNIFHALFVLDDDVTRWIAFSTGCSRIPCWTNWAQGSSNFKYFQNWKLFMLDQFWHHSHILPECDVVVAQQFTSLAADKQMNKHKNTFIIFQIDLIPGTAECEGDRERDKDCRPGQQNLKNWK